MAPRNPRPQDEVLFEGSQKWNREIDHEFVKQLVKFCKGRTSPLTKNDTNIIGASMGVVNQNCKVNFTQQDALYWFKRLQRRWRAFGFAINVQGVRYDPRRNIIRCNPTLWDYIYVYHRIAEAYMTCGEPEWLGLQKIFGPPIATDVSEYPDIIQISDDSIEIVNHNTNSGRPSEFGGTCNASSSKTNQTLGSSFWDCLDPIGQLSGGEASSRAQYGHPVNYGPSHQDGHDAQASEESVDAEPEPNPLGSQASSSSPNQAYV